MVLTAVLHGRAGGAGLNRTRAGGLDVAGGENGVNINLTMLGETATGLGRIANDLGKARSTADYDAHLVSQADLASALGEFSDNWKIHREELTKAVQGAHGFVTKAVASYRELDRCLTEAMTPDGQGGK